MSAIDTLTSWRKSWTFFPTLVGAFVLALLLLFYKDLDPALRNPFVPALVVYVLGSGLIGFWHYVCAVRDALKLEAKQKRAPQEGKEPPSREAGPLWRFVTAMVLHGLWLAAFAAFVALRVRD